VPSDPSSHSSHPIAAEHERLDSWKEIAAYLNRSVSTVQRWEAEEGLPVHRLLHAKAGTVYALKGDLDAWRSGRENVALLTRPVPAPEIQAPADESGPSPWRISLWAVWGAFSVSAERGATSPRPRWPLWQLATLLVLVLALASAAAIGIRRSWPVSPAITSLAVLPLENPSDAPDYVADGITDELIGEFSRTAQLDKVINTRSVMGYKGTREPASVIARQLGVDALLTGAVYQSGGRIRITAQLVSARDDRVLWAGSFDREIADVLALQRELATEVMRSVRLRLLPADRAQAPSVEPIAYDLYLRGLQAYNEFYIVGSQALFRQAAERDPRFAAAHAMRALALMIGAMGGGGWEPGEAQGHERAREAATTALALDDTIAAAHTAHAMVLVHRDLNWTEGDEAYRRAIALAPNDSTVRLLYAHHLGLVGRLDASVAEAKRAVALDPGGGAEQGDIQRRFVDAQVLWVVYNAGHWEECATLGEKMGARGPRHGPYNLGLRIIDYCDARLGRAADVCSRVHVQDQPLCGYAQLVAGNREEAQRILQASCAEGRANTLDVADCPILAAALGNVEPLLRLAEELRGWAFLKTRNFELLKDEPRYHALLQEMGLPP
jgi:TolB-like protein